MCPGNIGDYFLRYISMALPLEKIMRVAKTRGFINQSSEVYGGFSSSYDYGPLGVELKNNLKRAWWESMVYKTRGIFGLDSAILMNPRIWEASGHVENFHDPLVEDLVTHKRYRVDHLLEAHNIETDTLTMDDMRAALKKHNIKSPDGNPITEPRQFNLMMKTHIGPAEDTSSLAYLRPETAQGIYVNFHWVRESMRARLPFGIAQIGKAFRNEITPGNFTYRMREFEQMEMQYFVRPDNGMKFFEEWKEKRMQWYISLGIKKENLRFHEHTKAELAHYARAAVDIQYKFPDPMGWKELEGIHHRGDWDLSRHSKYSGNDLSYQDDISGERFIPHIIETSAGADRATLVFLLDAYEEIAGGRTTTTEATKDVEAVMRFSPAIAPVAVAVLPLVKNKPPITELAHTIAAKLRVARVGLVLYDESGSIGRRYRRQDEVGTPYCITVDFDSLEQHTVTVRNRDTMSQERIAIADLEQHILSRRML